MESSNRLFIATSMDGYIADKNGGIDWLDSIPEINTIDTGYDAFMKKVDALLMGRATYEKVLSFNIPWPYPKPVFVLSNTLTTPPVELTEKVFIVKGTVPKVLAQIHGQGYHHLYIDGGQLIQSFLRHDLVDEMIITIIPVLLGEGIPLFGNLPRPLAFECWQSKIFLGSVVQNHFRRRNDDYQ